MDIGDNNRVNSRRPAAGAYRMLRLPAAVALAAWFGLPATEAFAADCTTDATDGASLATAIGEVNAGSCDTINITGDISLSSQSLPIIDRSGATITIQGSGGQRIVDGTGTSRLFAVVNGNVTLSNMNIENGLAEGGDGGSDNRGGGAAGGALGAGGGLFVGAGGTVTLEDVDLGGNTAQGGDGGDATAPTGASVGGAGAGGGGLNGGAGGSGSTGAVDGGAGGGGGFGADGGGFSTERGGAGGGGGGNNAAPGAPGTAGNPYPGGSGGTGDGGAGGAGADGDSGDAGAAGSGMGGGGGGGSSNNSAPAGDGGAGGALGGGGGGGGEAHFATSNGTGDGGDGGAGGFGGGGGGGGQSYKFNVSGTWYGGVGGLGGFGAGGGGGGSSYGTSFGAGSPTPTPAGGAGAAGGFLGGDGGGGGAATGSSVAGGGGGGGAGLGGAIFVQNGGQLNIGQNVTFGANTVAGGAGGTGATTGTAGGSAGANIYAIDGTAGLGSNATVGFHVDANVGSGSRSLGDSDLDLLQSGYSGQLRKSGDGNLMLESNSGFTTGGWSVDRGFLQGTTDNLIGDLDIAVNGTLVIAQSTAGTLAGDITGTGNLVKDDSGNVTLTGNNDAHTGSVDIEDGTLTVNGSGLGDTSAVGVYGGSLAIGAAGETIGSLTGNGDVSLGGALDVGGNNASTVFSGDISGSGSLTKSGTGTMLLSGDNSYTGGTTIDAGTLIGMTSSLTGDIVNNSALVFAQDTDGTYADDISGNGSLTKASSGTLTLSGSNSYSGGTTITAGTLRGTTSSLVGDVVNNSTLEFDQAGNGTHTGDISGSGGLVKSGGGTVTLSGTNSYYGGTTIAAGTLRGTTLSLVGDVANDGTLEFDQATDGSHSGDISGGGGLVKSGSGTVTLSGSNSYSGGTTIAAGTLRGTTSSLTGNIANNSALEFDQAGNGTFAGQISGSGSLTKSGSGNVTLSGNNDAATGSVQIDAGTLTVNGSGLGDTSDVTLGGGSLAIGAAGETIGSLAGSGSVTLGGALTAGGNDSSTTYSGSISGSGSLAKAGTGTLSLSGTNSYSGGTTISAGTLRGTTSSLAGDIVNDSTLEFDQTGNGTYAGDISGSGGLVKSGSGTVMLSGSNTYSGGTTISAGTLAGTTLSLTGDILNNGTLAFAQAFDGTYADDISGSGGLVKAGSGTVTLSGSNTYSGNTTIAAGSLAVNGSLASDVTVATGGTLQGTGSVGSTTVNGLLAPGNSIGTLSVNGNLDMTPSSVFEVEFDDAGNADKATVAGTANLDGTLRLAPEVGTYASGTQYTILEAATVTGQFANATMTNVIRLGGLSATVTYDADKVQLALKQASFGGALGPGSGSGSGPVADYLDWIRPDITGDLENDVGTLEVLPLEELDQALQSLSPQVADAVPHVHTAFGRVVTDAMEVRLERLRIAELRRSGQPGAGFLPQLAAAAANATARDELLEATHSVGSLDLPAPRSWEDEFLALVAPNNQAASLAEFGNQNYTAWAQMLGEAGNRDSDGDLLGYNYRVFGVTSGIEQHLTSDLDIGALLAVGHSNVDFDRDRGDNTELTYSAGAYLGWMPLQGVTIDLTGWGGYSRLDGKRRIRFAGMDRTAESDTKVYSVGADLRAEYVESWRNFRLGGFGAAGFLSNWQESYCENGAGALNLCVDAANTQQVTGEVGLSAAYDVELRRGNLMIDAELAATGTLPLDDRLIQSGFAGEDRKFLIPGDDREELGFSPRLELTYQMQDESELSISYKGQFSESLAAHGVQIGLRIPF